MKVHHPWLEWQKQTNPETTDDPALSSCPFCSSKHLTLTLGFDSQAARVCCRTCQAAGPWICTEHRGELIARAKLAWNSQIRFQTK